MKRNSFYKTGVVIMTCFRSLSLTGSIARIPYRKNLATSNGINTSNKLNLHQEGERSTLIQHNSS